MIMGYYSYIIKDCFIEVKSFSDLVSDFFICRVGICFPLDNYNYTHFREKSKSFFGRNTYKINCLKNLGN